MTTYDGQSLSGFVILSADSLRGLPGVVERCIGERQPVVDLAVFELLRFHGDALQAVLRPAAVKMRRWKMQDFHSFSRVRWLVTKMAIERVKRPA